MEQVRSPFLLYFFFIGLLLMLVDLLHKVERLSERPSQFTLNIIQITASPLTLPRETNSFYIGQLYRMLGHHRLIVFINDIS